MHVVSLISKKGGAAKTTSAITIATQAARWGLTTALLDTDAQRTAAKWAETRDDDKLIVKWVAEELIDTAIEKLAEAGCDLVVFDTPPTITSIAMKVAHRSDLIVVPCKTSKFDVDATNDTLDALKPVDPEMQKTLLLMTDAPPTGTMTGRFAMSIHKRHGVEICPIKVVHRSAYSMSMSVGEDPVEFSHGKASDEQIALTKHIFKRLGIKIGEEN